MEESELEQRDEMWVPDDCGFENLGRGPQATEYRQLLKAGKDKLIYSPLETSEGTLPCQPLAFRHSSEFRITKR